MNQASLSSKDARVSPASPATSVVETRAHAPEFVALLGRIREYREQSLENRQPLRAVLGCLTADVLETRSYVSQSLRDDFAESPPGVRDLQGLAPLLALDAGLAKQAVQLIDRGLREAEAEAIETPRLPDRPR